VRKLPYDAQRDMAFYQTFVQFRNAVERMMLRRGTLRDGEHVFWGFPSPPRRYPDPGADDDGRAGSRIPRRPHPDTGGAAAVSEQIDWEEGGQLPSQVSDARVTLPHAD
jgi:hypothetical protein